MQWHTSASQQLLNKRMPYGLNSYYKQCDAYNARQQRQLLKEFPFGVPAANSQSTPDLCCGKCGETKPATEFYRISHMRSGRQHICKPCRRMGMAARRATKRLEQSVCFPEPVPLNKTVITLQGPCQFYLKLSRMQNQIGQVCLVSLVIN